MANNATVRLYHPSGALCIFPIGDLPNMAMQDIQDFLQAGFLPIEPEPVEGEKVDPIGWVCRRSRISEVDGKEVPILDCYVDHPAMTKKFITVYLNTSQQQEDFEALSGSRLDRIPFWIGDKAPERGDKRETDAYIYRLPQPIGVVHKPNPKYNPDEPDINKRKPKRLFVGWRALSVGVQPEDEAPSESTNGRKTEGVPPDDQLTETGDPNTGLILVREIKFTKVKGQPYMNLIGEDGAFVRLITTKDFADAGFKPKDWLEAGGTTFDPPLSVQYVHDGEVVKIVHIGELEF